MSEETKNEELQEEVEATDVVTEEKQKNSLKKRLKTKNCKKHLNVLKILKINTFEHMLKCKIFNAVLTKNVSNYKIPFTRFSKSYSTKFG